MKAAAPSSSVATRAARGILWTGSPFLLQIAISVAFYGYLRVEEMGGFEWALILVMLLALMCSLGLEQALVQNRAATELHYSSAFWLNLALGLATCFVVMHTAPFWARHFAGDDLEDPVAFIRGLSTLSLILPCAAVSGIFRARLQRDLQFRPMALAEAFSAIVYSGVAIVLLLFGWGIRAPAISAVVREVALLAGLVWSAAWRPRFAFRVGALRDLLPFGLHFTASRCVNYVNSNLPSFFIVPFLGTAALGYYRFAYRLTLQPLVRVSTVITRVIFPTFSTIQDDDALLGRGYLRTVGATALAFWPALVGLLVFAPEGMMLLRQLKGLDMSAAVLPLRFLILATMLKAVGTPVGSIFLAKGKASWSLYWSLFSFAVLVPTLYWSVTSQVAGVSAVCGVIAVTAIPFLLLSQLLADRLIGLRFAEYLRALGRPALVAALLLGLLVLVRPALPADLVLTGVLAVLISVGASGLLVRGLAWGQVRALWRDLRGPA